MLSENDAVFTKDNLDDYLKDLAKEFRKMNGTAMPAEIILVGGAAVIANYGFRSMTADIDAIIQAASSIKDAINHVGDKFNLPNGWINADFMCTESYSPRLSEISTHYKMFSHVLEVRTVSAEYLIAMKLRSSRTYKNDLSDIIGILAEHERNGCPISYDSIDRAVQILYGDWSKFPIGSNLFIKNTIKNANYADEFLAISREEAKSKNLLLQFDKNYPRVAKESNVEDILQNLRAKQQSSEPESIAERIKRIKSSGREKGSPQSREKDMER